MHAKTQIFVEALVGHLAGLTEAAKDALEWEPGRIIYVASGAQVAWDDCCDGQLWARLVTLEPGEPVGGRNSGARMSGPCGYTHYFASVELGIVRCALVLDDQGTAPNAADLTAEGLAGLADMGALLEAIKCFPATRSISRWTPTGPQGGCVGGFWTLSIRLDDCVGCE